MKIQYVRGKKLNVITQQKNTKVDVKEDNLNWTETHGHVYRILIAGRSESVKKKKKKRKCNT